MKKYLFYLVSILLFSSCLGADIEKNIVGNYYLMAADVENDLTLSYHEPTDGSNYGTVIGATVFAIGYNDKYIVAKQHPRTFANPTNKSVTNYFILPIRRGFDWNNRNGLMGPFTLEQFNKTSSDLKIGKIEFSIVYKDL